MATPPVWLIQAVTSLGNGLHRLADLPLPAEVRVMNRSSRGMEGQLMRAFVELGLPEAMEGSTRSVEELAAELGLHAPTLLRLLRASEAIDLVERRDSGYRLTRDGRALRATAPIPMDSWTRYITSPAVVRAWHGLADAVRTGKPPFERANGKSLWPWFADHPDDERDFAATMRVVGDIMGPDLAASYPWPKGARICDFAGGVGTMLGHVLATDESLSGVVVDSAGPIAQAPEFLASRGVGDRAEAVVGDLFGRVEVEADIYLLKDILHDWDDEHCHTILANLAAALKPDGRIVLAEIIQDPERAHPIVPLVDLQMLTQTDGGRQRTLEEYDELFAAHGLRRTRVVPGATHALIEAVLA